MKQPGRRDGSVGFLCLCLLAAAAAVQPALGNASLQKTGDSGQWIQLAQGSGGAVVRPGSTGNALSAPVRPGKQPAPLSGKQKRKLGSKEDKAAWAQVQKIRTCSAYHHYLRTFPKGRHSASALKALRTCEPRTYRYRGPLRVYFSYYPPYFDPFWPWGRIPVPPIVVLPPDIIDPEPELPIEPPINPEPELPIAPEPELPELIPELMPEPDFGDLDGGFDSMDMDMDLGGFD